jgi:hypothetical protein
LLALATLYKPFCIVNAICYGVVHVAFPRKGDYRRAVRDVFLWAVTGALVWTGVAGYFALTDRWSIFYATIVTFNRFYTRRPVLHLANATPYFVDPILTNLGHYASLLGLIVLGSVAAAGKIQKRIKWLLLATAIAAYANVALPGRWFQHYFQLWLPLLAIAAGWALVSYQDNLRNRFLNLPSPNLLAALAMALLVAFEIPYYKLDPMESSREIEQEFMVDAYELSGKLEPLLLPHESLVQFGDSPMFYFYTHRPSPTGLLFASHLRGQLRSTLTARFIQDVQRSRPEILVLDSFARYQQHDKDLLSLLTERYVPISPDFRWHRFEVRILNGGALEARLRVRSQPVHLN